jgi:hypothetical protein
MKLDRQQTEYAPTSPDTVVRFAITHLNQKGQRELTLGAQGRFTFDTADEAQKWTNDFQRHHDEGTLKQAYGSQVIGTFQVRAVACYPGDHDVKGVWFDDDVDSELLAKGVTVQIDPKDSPVGIHNDGLAVRS